MRIIGGTRRGRRLVEWDEEGIRPMRDFVRSALFNIVSDFVSEAAFLDLYCGTGSVGLEALSRGAATCTFVDHSPEACAIVRRNLDVLDFLAQAHVVTADAVSALPELGRLGRRYDLVFVGPPYYRELVPRTLAALAVEPVLADDPVVAAEIHASERVAEAYGGLTLVDLRKYGDNQLAFYRGSGPSGEATEREDASEIQ
ncbi:MAG: 16S rRNA (guanine(966)-N(2))-methyltransferase RsmD [Candidatus Bipolaricaulota bacterium]